MFFINVVTNIQNTGKVDKLARVNLIARISVDVITNIVHTRTL